MCKMVVCIFGHTDKAKRVVGNFRKILDDEFGDQYSLEVIDIRENPELADRYEVLATPMAIKTFPEPRRRIIGDLSNREKVLFGLNLKNVRNEELGEHPK
jgi:circadian clock protein KaiB